MEEKFWQLWGGCGREVRLRSTARGGSPDRETEGVQDILGATLLIYPVLSNEWALQLNFPENVNMSFHPH
jgi:hypothetical protein